MVAIANYRGLELIKKYEHYYIRFSGGQHEEYLCDLKITETDASEIISDNTKIKTIMSEYKKKVSWTLNYFVNTFLKDYMYYECNMSQKRIEKNIEKLDRHDDIKTELYETLIYEMFPKTRQITVCGYTAQELNDNTHLSILGAYNFLIYLREDQANALEDLRKGLPVK